MTTSYKTNATPSKRYDGRINLKESFIVTNFIYGYPPLSIYYRETVEPIKPLNQREKLLSVL